MGVEIRVPSSLRLVDSGRWRERGVTHWHCVAEERAIFVGGKLNEERFDTDRIHGLVNSSFARAAMTPREAFDWLTGEWIAALSDPRRCPDPEATLRRRLWGTGEDWEFQLRHTWDTLITSEAAPAGCGIPIRDNWSLDAHCYPMTLARCRRHREADRV